MQKAAEQGEADAKLFLKKLTQNRETSAVTENTHEELKKLYEEGRYEESYKRARKLAADRGDAWAQYMLGIHLYNGKGVKEDRKKADFWLQKAAEQGDADAKLCLKKLTQN